MYNLYISFYVKFTKFSLFLIALVCFRLTRSQGNCGKDKIVFDHFVLGNVNFLTLKFNLNAMNPRPHSLYKIKLEVEKEKT